MLRVGLTTSSILVRALRMMTFLNPTDA